MKVLTIILLTNMLGLALVEGFSFRSLAKSARKRMRRLRESFQRPSTLEAASLGDEHSTPPANHKIKLSTHSRCKYLSHEFRTADGGCNNPHHPGWGQANSSYARMVDNMYDDEIGMPRQKGVHGGRLPGPRDLCTSMVNMESKRSSLYSYMVMQWGQFIDHDLQSTPTLQATRDACCAGVDSNYQYKSGPCFPIPIADDDGYFNVTCMKFTRSRPFDEHSAPREQFNAITSFVDGSVVYGSSDDEMNSLRLGKDGMMLTKVGDLLPEDDNPASCHKVKSEDYCFLAGDSRVNVFPGLAALHTIFVRFHNKIANSISLIVKTMGYFRSRVHDTYDDELIFQTTRKIVSAVLQKINYEEFLPLVLGTTSMKEHGLLDKYHYDPYAKPDVLNVFATAAFRFGHSMIPDTMRVSGEEIPIHKMYFKPNMVINRLADLINTLVANTSEGSEMSFSPEMANKLFPKDGFSLDIVSLNVQRGRDHGLGSYNAYRQACNLTLVTSFDSTVFGSCRGSLAKIYSSVHDVDVFIGAMCEPPVHDGILGETFACIVGRQFHNLKFGDRFWYEAPNRSGLAKHLLQFVNKITMSRILCDHGDIEEIQPYSFLSPNSQSNAVVHCSKISDYSTKHLVNHIRYHKKASRRRHRPKNFRRRFTSAFRNLLSFG